MSANPAIGTAIRAGFEQRHAAWGGKTGTGYQMNDDSTPDLSRQVGWFVGWAGKGKRAIVFVHALADEQHSPPARACAREAFMKRRPGLLDALPAPVGALDPAPVAARSPPPGAQQAAPQDEDAVPPGTLADPGGR